MLTWPNGAINQEQALVQTSTDGGATWSAPVNAAEARRPGRQPGGRDLADGSDVYLVYNAYLEPFQTTTANPRRMQGVARHADVGAGGALGAFTTLHRGAVGDAGARPGPSTAKRSTTTSTPSRHVTTGPPSGWTPATPADCPAVDAYRQSLIDGTPISPPSPLTDCPPQFGNLDIYSGSYPDPTP